MTLRAVLSWSLLAILGLAAAAAVSIGASRLSVPKVGLSSEPLTAGARLAPRTAAHHDRARTHRHHPRAASPGRATSTPGTPQIGTMPAPTRSVAPQAPAPPPTPAPTNTAPQPATTQPSGSDEHAQRSSDAPKGGGGDD